IIFQYPLFWYNVPAIMKEWIDNVFTYGFAFGKGNYQLENKKVIASFTTGTSINDYPKDVIDKISFPIRGLADYCKMEYITQVVSHEINAYSDEAKKKSEYNAELHVQQLIEIINSH
ncbi:MAG: NAD(P)H-dependent oxidoreductase, partial [Flavobacteriales bacterium]|nr:NAD(P)H-dependent oxidoreductase [Flavobacteriales bacterium]